VRSAGLLVGLPEPARGELLLELAKLVDDLALATASRSRTSE
jgi:hypothetical protein